jgi:hypothetical protein
MTQSTKLDRLTEYFNLQEELFSIQDSRDNWPDGMTYGTMCERINELTIEVRKLAKQLTF